MNKLKKLFLLFSAACVLAFSADTRAQSLEDGTVAVRSASLTTINLPSGARRVNDEQIPSEFKQTLSKLVASGGEGITEGDSEVIVWSGNYKATRGRQMIQNLETALKNAGWQYEPGAQTDEFTTFGVYRLQPAKRAAVGFFIPNEDGFIFAVAEMLRAGSTENPVSSQKSEVQPRTSGSVNSGLFGRWFRTIGGGSRDWTGKTQYNAGEDFYFEFFPDGSVTYSREKDVLTIMQCKIKESQKARGRFTVSGNTLNIELGEMSSVGSNSCDAKGNFNKKLEPSKISVTFVIKKMESITRPDNPTIMCFDGSDEVCYEKVNK